MENRGYYKKIESIENEKDIQSEIKKEMIMWRKEAEMNLEKVKKKREGYGSWKGKVENKILKMAADNMDLVKRSRKAGEKKRKEKRRWKGF